MSVCEFCETYEVCEFCQGEGKIYITTYIGPGDPMPDVIACEECKGSGLK